MVAEVLDKKIAYFTTSIMNELQAKASRMRHQEAKDLQAWADVSLAMAEKELQSKLDGHSRDLARYANREISQATARAKMAYHATVAALVDDLMAGVAGELTEFAQSPEYMDYLLGRIRAAGVGFAVVILPPGHMHFAEEIEAATGLVVEAGEDDYIGGFMLLTEGRKARLDCTFKAKLEEAGDDPPWQW
ncbi:MAG: V-type ATP synthase subunit E [Defluviitaleaceae bacterium]|nr:V-type ATP synthase subunit E [Defluviitaleaceae bacterium]